MPTWVQTFETRSAPCCFFRADIGAVWLVKNGEMYSAVTLVHSLVEKFYIERYVFIHTKCLSNWQPMSSLLSL